MKNVLILTFSGAGATKKVATIMRGYLQGRCAVSLCPFEHAGKLKMGDYDAFVIGSPVYHGAPSKMVTGFIDSMRPLERTTPAFLYNTRATWSCNTNRIMAKGLIEKNIVTIMDRDYRSPASDGSLIVPFVQRFHEFDKQLSDKIQSDCAAFHSIINSAGISKGYIPHFRVSSVINAPNKLAGQLITFKIHLHSNKCSKCGKCIEDCPHKAVKRDDGGFPAIDRKRCENCYRCIHHCPAKALSLSRKRAPKKLLTYENQ